MTIRALIIEAPKAFNRVPRPEQILPYDMEILTPMLGGGVKSWQPDDNNLIRSQSIKGQLRFWWRTMQCCNDSAVLKEQENAIWGSTTRASKVRLAVTLSGELEKKELSRNEKGNVQYGDFPGYVLFPLQGSNKDEKKFTVITGQKFKLTVHCRSEDKEIVENTVKLWVLFGGIGARTRRGCGSVYCQQIMEEFSSPEKIQKFIQKFQNKDKGAKAFTEAPYPQLQNCRFAWHLLPGKGNDATEAWNSFLVDYGNFRQGEGLARERRTSGANHPGPTRWPEADAIRLLTGKIPGLHTSSAHPAEKWFPRAAYGLPILTEFQDQSNEPKGQISLAPASKGHDRWPSPVILKIIKLVNGGLLKTCLILNHNVPEKIKLVCPGFDDHTLTPDEMPLSCKGKVMPANAPLNSYTSPYTGIINFLKLKET